MERFERRPPRRHRHRDLCIGAAATSSQPTSNTVQFRRAKIAVEASLSRHDLHRRQVPSDGHARRNNSLPKGEVPPASGGAAPHSDVVAEPLPPLLEFTQHRKPSSSDGSGTTSKRPAQPCSSVAEIAIEHVCTDWRSASRVASLVVSRIFEELVDVGKDDPCVRGHTSEQTIQPANLCSSSLRC